MYRMNHLIHPSLGRCLHLVIFDYLFLILMDSNKDILNRAIGRPAMMAFMILVGTYLTTGQLIPGVYKWKIKINQEILILKK